NIRILHNYYIPSKTEEINATGILVRTPNTILTARLTDGDGNDIYGDRYSKYVVCEQVPDPVRLQAKIAEIEKKAEDAESTEFKSFKEIYLVAKKDPEKEPKDGKAAKESKKGDVDPKQADKEVREQLLKYKNFSAEEDGCSRFRVAKIDRSRNLVLLE